MTEQQWTNLRIRRETADALKQQMEGAGVTTSLQGFVEQILQREVEHGAGFSVRPIAVPVGLSNLADAEFAIDLGHVSTPSFVILYRGAGGVPTVVVGKIREVLPSVLDFQHEGGHSIYLPRALIVAWTRVPRDPANEASLKYGAVVRFLQFGAAPHPQVPQVYTGAPRYR